MQTDDGQADVMPSAQVHRGAVTMSVDDQTSDHGTECPVGYTVVDEQASEMVPGY